MIITDAGQDINSNITIESGNLIINNCTLNGQIINNGGTVNFDSCIINGTVQGNSGSISINSSTLNGTLDKNGGEMYVDGETVCVLHYDSNGGTPVYEDETYPKGTAVYLKTGPTQEGKRFLYWRSNSDGMSYSGGDAITINSDLTLVAQWMSF